MSNSDMQKAVHVTKFNQDNPAAAVGLVDVKRPEPKEGEVLVHICMRPVNPADIFSLQGRFQIDPWIRGWMDQPEHVKT